MDSGTINSILVVRSLMAVVLFFVFTYLYRQSRETYFRYWQVAWFFYCIYYGFYFLNHSDFHGFVTVWSAKLLFALVALCIFASTRLLDPEQARHRWVDGALAVLIVAWSAVDARATLTGVPLWAHLRLGARELHIALDLEMGIAALLLACAYKFAQQTRKHHSAPAALLALSLTSWAVLVSLQPYAALLDRVVGDYRYFLDAVPQMLLGISMVMVLFESERRAVQENLLAFSSLEEHGVRALDPRDLAPSLEAMLDRLLTVLHAERGAFWMADNWRSVLPLAQRGFAPGFLHDLTSNGGGEALHAWAAVHAGQATTLEREEVLRASLRRGHPLELVRVLAQNGVGHLAVVVLEAGENNYGVLCLASPKRGFGSSQIRLLTALARQISMTLDNYTLMHEAQRRTEEYELLTQIGQVVASRLDPDEVLRTVHRELGKLFDTRTFYIAFQEGDEVHFEFETREGVVQNKRARRNAKGITETILHSGEALLIRSDMEGARTRLGIESTGPSARCFCGVPIYMYGRAVGVMATLNYEREFVYEQRDLDVMKTAAGQVAVAMENARLFAEEQRRAKYLAFLNSVSKTAISSQEPDSMLEAIVREIQDNFKFDHIGIGLVDYATKEIEIKAEAGTTALALGKRIPLGVGILGRVARSGEMVLQQSPGEGHLLGILPDSKSVLCVPVTYGESMLGVLNVESQRENAFAPQETLILRTLADLLAAALHNAFVFQKMQQQSITDGLTGIKTRRFFSESLQAEWKRAARSGRSFSLVLIDLDKFKQVNDNMGHLEGDLVLARIGRILEQRSRQSNVVARYGGDEFVILMPETGVEQAQILSERLRLWIATDPMLNDRQITGSFGVATFPLHGATAEDVMRVADECMYHSKRAGGNRVSTPEEFGEGETLVSKKHLVRAYVEGFLQRTHTGPELIEELVSTLGKMSASIRDGSNADALMEAVKTLTLAEETRELHSSGHSEAVAQYAESLGRSMKLPPDEVQDLVVAARVHDVGKILVPEKILNKAEPLTADEMKIVRMHAQLGAQIVDTIPGSGRVAKFVRHHQERFDGSGYPDGLRGEDIPLGARIIAVAEAYVHMTMDRPYAPKRSTRDALAELEARSGTQFDGMVVRTFLRQLRSKKTVHETE